MGGSRIGYLLVVDKQARQIKLAVRCQRSRAARAACLVVAADATQSAADGATVSPIFGWLETPQESHDEDGNFRPTVLMKRVSEYLERSPGGSLRAIRMAVKGKGASIDIAVETLIREGYIRVEKGTRDASFHFLIRPFDDKE